MSNFNIKDFVRNTQLSQVKDTENKELLNENIIGLEPINELPTREKEGYELAFAKFLSEDDQEPIHRREEDEDYDADAEQDDENVGMGYDDEGRPLGEGNMELRDEAMVYWIGKLLDKEINLTSLLKSFFLLFQILPALKLHFLKVHLCYLALHLNVLYY